MSRMFFTVFLALLVLAAPLLVLAPSNPQADRGMIPVHPNISVYEPGQKAIVAWNGTDEVLILSTDVIAQGDTAVVEIMPLPSQPYEVDQVEFEVFERLHLMVLRHAGDVVPMPGSFKGVEGVEVVFHEAIGMHDVTVVTASNATELSAWIRDFMHKINPSASLPEGLEDVVEDYLARGLKYFALDVVYLTNEYRSVKPILYMFKTSYLYYPLKISSIIPGESSIVVFAITKEKLRETTPLNKASYVSQGGEVPIEVVLSKEELKQLDPRIAQLFYGDPWLTALSYRGELSDLSVDLIVGGKPTAIPQPPQAQVLVLIAAAAALVVSAVALSIKV